MFAIIKNGGRQYKVSAGDKLEVNRMVVEVGKQVQFEEVLLISDADTTMVGSPLVENAMVLATVVGHARGEKVIVFKYKSKKRYRHRRGHRQELTIFSIDDIVAGGKSLLTGEAPRFQEEQEEEEQAPEVQEKAAPEAAGEVETAEQAEQPAETEGAAESEKKPTRRRRQRRTEETEGEQEE